MKPAVARRIALGAQGFGRARPSGRVDVRHFRRALDDMAVLQLDSVNVVCRSHYLPMFARLGDYDREALDRWLWRSRENVEGLCHEASISPMRREPDLRWRQTGRWRVGEQLEAEHPEALERVLDEIRERGPLSVSDLSDPGDRTGPWWGYSPGKTALERLYVTGRLNISWRTHQFTSVYDLPERVVPDDVRSLPTPAPAEAHRRLLDEAARACGIATMTDLADYVRLRNPVARPIVAEMVADGTLVETSVDGWSEPALVHHAASRPRSIDVCTLLSPFDPITWCRPRAERLFGFHYRIEIYVPEAKRQYGYYVLPFLLGEQLAGRVDVKADRTNRVLLARGVFGEAGVDRAAVAEGLARALGELAAFLDLDGVEVGRRGDLAEAVRDLS